MSAVGKAPLVAEILAALDPLLQEELGARLAQARGPTPQEQRAFFERLASGNLVLVGHRASGKSRLRPLIGRLLERPDLDLDHELARRTGRAVKTFVEEDPAGFRAAERRVFQQLPSGQVVAAGGGFLALHPELLEGHLPVLVPVTFETYQRRLREDPSRPRLRPHLTLEEELREVFEEREALHRAAPVMPLLELLRVAG